MNPYNILAIVNDHQHTPEYLEGCVIAKIALDCDYSSLSQHYMTPPEIKDDVVFIARLAEAVRYSQDGPAAEGMCSNACEWLGRELVRWVCVNAREEAQKEIMAAAAILQEETQDPPDHGYDRPEVERVALDRSAAA